MERAILLHYFTLSLSNKRSLPAGHSNIAQELLFTKQQSQCDTLLSYSIGLGVQTSPPAVKALCKSVSFKLLCSPLNI